MIFLFPFQCAPSAPVPTSIITTETFAQAVAYTRILSLHVQVRSTHQLTGAATWDPLPKWTPAKSGSEKSFQQDSAPPCRVKFRNPQEKKIPSGNLFPHIHNLFSMRQGESHPCTKGWQRLKHQFVPTETLLQDCTKDLTILFRLSEEALTHSDIKM